MQPCAQVHQKADWCVMKIGKQEGNAYGNRPVLIRRSGSASEASHLLVKTDESALYLHEGV